MFFRELRFESAIFCWRPSISNTYLSSFFSGSLPQASKLFIWGISLDFSSFESSIFFYKNYPNLAVIVPAVFIILDKFHTVFSVFIFMDFG